MKMADDYYLADYLIIFKMGSNHIQCLNLQFEFKQNVYLELFLSGIHIEGPLKTDLIVL